MSKMASEDSESSDDEINPSFSFSFDADTSTPEETLPSLLENFRSPNFLTTVDDKIKKLQDSKKASDGDKGNDRPNADESGEVHESDKSNESHDEASDKSGHKSNKLDDGKDKTGELDELRDVAPPRNKRQKKSTKRGKEAKENDVSTKKRKLSSTNTDSFADFGQLNLSRPLLRAVRDLGYTKPTPIQAACIPKAMAGSDILGNAVTGSGKTAAFMLPILERLLYRPKRVAVTRVLILTPTRELAAQCHKMTENLAKHTDILLCFVVGGLAMQPQEASLRNRPDIVIATPGRLIDHLRNSQSVHLEDLEILVLDEADRLLEEFFSDEIQEIIKMCPRERQTMLFSATLTAKVNQLAQLSLKSPIKVSVDALYDLASGLEQEFIRIRPHMESSREAILLSLCKRSFRSKTIVFFKSKLEAHRMKIIFGLIGLKAAELHGNMTQSMRLGSLDKFKDGEVDFLLCTDLASRGLDIQGVETVIALHFPKEIRSYVHRVGRTARAGKAGRSITFVTDQQRKVVKQIALKSKAKIRKVAPKSIEEMKKLISKHEKDVREIFHQERLEKDLRVAEMEANKLRNVLEHQSEIMSRPQREWFQTRKQKLEAKLKGHELNKTVADDTTSEKKKGKKKKKEREPKVDPLRGLSRKKKRRKLLEMEIEAERNAAERLADVKTLPQKEKAQKKSARKAKRRVAEGTETKPENGPEAGVDLPRKKKRKRRYTDPENQDRLGPVASKQLASALSKKRKTKHKKPSKKRYFRRK